MNEYTPVASAGAPLAQNQAPIVAVSPYGRNAGSTRVRLYNWFEHTGLPSEHHDYLQATANRISTILTHAPSAVAAEVQLRTLSRRLAHRTVIVSREASPFSSGRIEESLLRGARHSVYDFDDALYADTTSLAARIWSKKKRWIRAARAANVVIAGSAILAEAASHYSDNVVVIPSCVEPDRYIVKSEYGLSAAPRAVWIGSPATEPFLLGIADALTALHKKFGLRVTVISRGDSDLGALSAIVDRIPWTQSTFASNLVHADFGIMPLPDNEYTRGKCSYKLLQYAAAGLPLVGSPVGTNLGVLNDLGGLAASSSDDWIDATSALIEMGSAERANLGAASRRGVIQEFSFTRWRDAWVTALDLQTQL